jgi:hypothetical protein
MTAPQGPIFIFGIGRSGTTLLARMLDLHPNLSIYLESGFLNLIDTRASNARLTDDTEVAALLDRVRNHADQGVLRERVEQRFAGTDRSVRSLFDCLLQLRMEARGKRRFGEKTPSHFSKVAVLRDWYPGAKFVYLRRDPRDAYASFKYSRDHRERSWTERALLGRCLYWNYYQDALLQAKGRFPEHVFEVEFESLVRDPAGTLAVLCDFLGEPFSANMLAVAENNSSFDDTRSRTGLRQETVDRKGRLTNAELACIEFVCGDRMLAEGRRLSSPSRHVVPLLTSLGFYCLSRRVHQSVRRLRRR